MDHAIGIARIDVKFPCTGRSVTLLLESHGPAGIERDRSAHENTTDGVITTINADIAADVVSGGHEVHDPEVAEGFIRQVAQECLLTSGCA